MIKHIREDFTASRPSHNIQRIISSRGDTKQLAINFNHFPPEGRRRNVSSTTTRRRRCRTRTRNAEFDLKKSNVLSNLRALRCPERPLCEVLQTNRRSRYTNSVSFNSTRLYKLSAKNTPLKRSEKLDHSEFVSELDKDTEWKKYLQSEFVL